MKTTLTQFVTRVAAIASVASLIFGRWRFGQPFDLADLIKVAQAVVLCVWIVVPPVWFWLEYFFIWKPGRDNKPGLEDHKSSLEEFKYGQDVSSKIWLVLVTALLGLYFGKDLMHH